MSIMCKYNQIKPRFVLSLKWGTTNKPWSGPQIPPGRTEQLKIFHVCSVFSLSLDLSTGPLLLLWLWQMISLVSWIENIIALPHLWIICAAPLKVERADYQTVNNLDTFISVWTAGGVLHSVGKTAELLLSIWFVSVVLGSFVFVLSGFLASFTIMDKWICFESFLNCSIKVFFKEKQMYLGILTSFISPNIRMFKIQ